VEISRVFDKPGTVSRKTTCHRIEWCEKHCRFVGGSTVKQTLAGAYYFGVQSNSEKADSPPRSTLLRACSPMPAIDIPAMDAGRLPQVLNFNTRHQGHHGCTLSDYQSQTGFMDASFVWRD
jgi:hypothetical protein